ncbi:MAG: tetratricopeptide repeat protein [Desulfovibrio sp.]
MLGNLLKKIISPPPVQVGKRNLERAWRATMNNDMDMARSFNTKAAQAFLEMLAQDEAKGKRTFPYRRVAAGIALLRNGDPEKAAQLLSRAIADQPVLFPAYVWAGLAYGQLGDAEKALRYWNDFPGVQAGQPVLNKILMEQKSALESGRTDLKTACVAVEQALLKQDRTDFREGREFWILERL